MPDSLPIAGRVVVLASRNAKKLDEMQRILEPLVPGIRVLGLDDVAPHDEPVEDAPDFAGNALIKARATLTATGLPSLADDSGLCVDALNGMPGVLSARWSGRVKSDERNNQLLLDQLYDVPDERRSAHFASAVALCWTDVTGSQERVIEDRMPGRVIREMRGSGGFGYDVMFVPDGYDRTSAELTIEEKDAISHRGRALREMAPIVRDVLLGD